MLNFFLNFSVFVQVGTGNSISLLVCSKCPWWLIWLNENKIRLWCLKIFLSKIAWPKICVINWENIVTLATKLTALFQNIQPSSKNKEIFDDLLRSAIHATNYRITSNAKKHKRRHKDSSKRENNFGYGNNNYSIFLWNQLIIRIYSNKTKFINKDAPQQSILWILSLNYMKNSLNWLE